MHFHRRLGFGVFCFERESDCATNQWFVPSKTPTDSPIASELKKVRFNTGSAPGEPPPLYLLGERFENLALAGITLINNSTKPLYNVTVEFHIWLQCDNGSIKVDVFTANLGTLNPKITFHLDQIPNGKQVYHMPPNCTWVKTTLKDAYAYATP